MQFGIKIKSYDPADEQVFAVEAAGIVDAVHRAARIVAGTQWVVHQVTDLERD